MNAKQEKFEDSACTLEWFANDIEHTTSAMLNECAAHIREAAQGHARYEALRCLNPREYTEMWRRNLAGDERFDDMVDELVKANNAKA